MFSISLLVRALKASRPFILLPCEAATLEDMLFIDSRANEN